MVGDHYTKKWDAYPFDQIAKRGPSDTEFQQLKKEVQEMKELLKRAVEYDKKNNEPDCKTDDKLRLLRQIAEAMGVKLDV